MNLTFPDPETFGESPPLPCERIDAKEYHTLTEFKNVASD